MPLDRLTRVLDAHVLALEEAGTAKGEESIVVSVKPAEDDRGPRFLLKGEGPQEFIRMNSNSYLGMGLREEVIAAEEHATRMFGAGPGAVRLSPVATTHTSSSKRNLRNFMVARPQ